MILTCPQCATRYQVDGTKFPAAGRNVRCVKCTHIWHQLGPEPEPDPDAEISVQESAPPPAQEIAAPAPRVAAFAPPPAEIAQTPVPPRARGTWLGRIAVTGGWLLLIGLMVVIGLAAVNFRENIATWVPRTSSFYAAAGLPITPRGIDFSDVAYHQVIEDGQGVLVVTGQIVNHSTHEQTVPPVRVTLLDADKHKIYDWNFVPQVSTLKPGAAAKFHTRLSSPPAATHDLEVRFTRAGE
jgi:predicted Zn finger-like uncharacterized protein